MKRICRFSALIMASLLFSVLLTAPALATAEGGSSQVLRFEDGSYVVITIEYDQPLDNSSFFASRSIKSGTKSYSYYENSNELMWVFRVHGTFTYNGVTASATGASYSYDIYGGSWSFVSGSATYSGATATATGTFKHLVFPNTLTLTLTCSPDGVLS